jgi:hypothetical protein
LEILLRGNQ